MKPQLADLISPKAIAVCQSLTKEQVRLVKILSGPLDDLIGDADRFCERTIKALSFDDNCSGLAFIPEGASANVLVSWLKAEFLCSISSNFHEDIPLPVMEELIRRLEITFKELRTLTEWSHVGSYSQPMDNRLTNFHGQLLGSPAYHLVVARLHRGTCSKIRQLEGQPKKNRNKCLEGFVSNLIRVAVAIPADAILPSLEDYAEGEFDQLVRRTIVNLRKKSIDRDGNTRYAEKTLKKFLSTWGTAFYSTADEKNFQNLNVSRRKQEDQRRGFDREPDRLAASHSLRKNYLEESDRLAAQEDMEWRQLFLPLEQIKVKSKRVRKNALSPGQAVLIFNHGSTKPDVPPLTVLSLIRSVVENNFYEWCEFNCKTVFCLLQMMLHLGRRPEWLSQLILGKSQNSIWECSQPVFVADKGKIYFQPGRYMGLPDWLQPSSDVGSTQVREVHEQIFESISLIHETWLPSPVAHSIQTMIEQRRDLLVQHSQVRGPLQNSPASSPLFLWQDGNVLRRLDEDILKSIFECFTQFIQSQIPGYPRIGTVMFTRSFDAYYEEYGLRGVYRFYISERAHRCYEMPERYSCVNAQKISQDHEKTCCQFEKDIVQQARAMGLGEWEDERRSYRGDLQNTGPDVFFGSWRCIRKDVVTDIVHGAKLFLKYPSRLDDTIRMEFAHHNALILYSALCLAILNGLRPFEIARLRCNDIDRSNRSIFIKGKPHGSRAAYRTLPVLSEVVNLLGEIMVFGEMEPTSKSKFFQIYSYSRRRAIETSDLDKMLPKAYSKFAMTNTPIFYGFRHRFRTDMLNAELPETEIDYLMGHESQGYEAWNVFREERFSSPKLYLQAAASIALEYGLLPMPRFNSKSIEKQKN